MSLGRAIAGISATLCIIGLTAIGQQKGSRQTTANTRLERCKAAMPTIFKNYNNAKYAVFRATNAGAEAASILGPVREAQAALDAMDQPLKGCYEAMQNTQAEQRPDSKQ